MSYYVTEKTLEGNAGLAKQHKFIANSRKADYANETVLMQRGGLEVNDARIPADVWRDFDRQIVDIMRSDEGAVIMNDLMPFARNVDIGKIVTEYRQYSESVLEVRSSIDGQHAKPVNNTGFQYDGSLVLVHSTQVGRQWRELAGMRSEGYDQLLDDQAAAVRYVNRRMVDDMVNGTAELSYKGYGSLGIKANPNTIAFDLGAVDLTSASTTYEVFYTTFVNALRAIQGEGNNARGNVTFYVSSGIYWNAMRIANPDTNNTDTIMAMLLRIPGVAGIKQSDELQGNEFIALILSSEYIRPVIGMPVTTTPIPRVTPMDDWHVLVWSASGLQVKADALGRSGVLYAST